jgi:hypothetical protein
MTVKTQQFYYNLLLQGYMFRLLRVIIRPSNEPTQDYLIPSVLWDPGIHHKTLPYLKGALLSFCNFSGLYSTKQTICSFLW